MDAGIESNKENICPLELRAMTGKRPATLKIPRQPLRSMDLIEVLAREQLDSAQVCSQQPETSGKHDISDVKSLRDSTPIMPTRHERQPQRAVHGRSSGKCKMGSSLRGMR